MVLFCGCSRNNFENTYVDPELASFLNETKDEIERRYESTGKFKCDVSAKGNEMIVNLYLLGKDNCTASERSANEMAFNAMRSTYRKQFETIKEQEPALEGVEMNILEEDGDMIVRLTFDL